MLYPGIHADARPRKLYEYVAVGGRIVVAKYASLIEPEFNFSMNAATDTNFLPETSLNAHCDPAIYLLMWVLTGASLAFRQPLILRRKLRRSAF